MLSFINIKIAWLYLLGFVVVVLSSCSDLSTASKPESCNNQCRETGIFCDKEVDDTVVFNCRQDDNGCFIREIFETCKNKEVCIAGECQIKECESQCNIEGYFCDGNQRYECGNFDNDICLEKREVPCNEGDTCVLGKCEKACEPTTEICDGIDNDCDGFIDEGFSDTDDDNIADCVDIDDDNDGINDLDEDGNPLDNCPLVANTDQIDTDNDGFGDVCDECIDDANKYEAGICGCGVVDVDIDTDGDGIVDCNDNCVYTANTDQVDTDNDGKGDVCDMCGEGITPEEICNGKDDDCNGVVDEPGVCDSNCTREEYNGHVYLFCDEEVNWFEAENKCNSMGYTLVKIDNETENTWIKDTKATLMNDSDIYIGLNDLTQEGNYYWNYESSSLVYSNWGDNQPNDIDRSENCVEMNSLGRWDDVSCMDKLNSYVCENNSFTYYSSCKEILDKGFSIGDGVYTIDLDGLDGKKPFKVYCDMTTDGGGWMLVASWNIDYEWTKYSTSSDELFDSVPKDRVSSNFGDALINDFRIMASENLSLKANNAKADWYYHYNTAITWKEVWAPHAHSNSNTNDCSNAYISTGDIKRQALKKFNYSKNIKFDYINNKHHWNNLSDWGSENFRCGTIANYWGALTTKGIDFGVYNNSYDINGGIVGDGTLGIGIKGNEDLKTGQNVSTDYNARVGYDDDISCAKYGTSETDVVFHNYNTQNIEDATKLWWFIR